MNARSPDNPRPLALLSFDVEEHCQIEAARGTVDPRHWSRWPGRIEHNLDWLLPTLADHKAMATFFVLGWVARQRPWIVRRIAEAGHELACHGYAHDRLHRLDARRLAIDLAAARAAIEDQTQQRLRGYRAPSFSLSADTAWAVDVIARQGFDYDSSVQPIHHPTYGQADAPRRPYRLAGRSGATLAELPPMTWQVGRYRLPVAGGGYFRLLPLWTMRRGIAQADRDGWPGVTYFHPWEFDAHQPRLPLSPKQQLRTYLGLRQTRRRLARLLRTVQALSYSAWLDQADASDWPIYHLPAGQGAHGDAGRAAFDVLRQQGDVALRAAAEPQRRAAAA